MIRASASYALGGKKMYGWGGDTSSWRGTGKYNFDSARSPYLDKLAKDASAKGPRSYTRRGEPNMGLVDPRGKTISTDSENPIVLAVDVTGSMASWPGEIFDRLPLLYQTLSQYKDDVEISFAAIGDANCDSYPLQVNDFGKGVGLEDNIKALGCEGGGGGQIRETYELFGYFMAEHCKMPNAKSPFMFIYGDEHFYTKLQPSHVKRWTGDDIGSEQDSTAIWKKLNQKFNLFFLHKPFGYGDEPSIDKQVVDQWGRAIGAEKVIELPSCERAVDIAMGIVAKYWDRFDDFDENLSARQDDSEKASVYNSLRFLSKESVIDPARSVTLARHSTNATKSLSEMFDSAKKTKSKRSRRR